MSHTSWKTRPVVAHRGVAAILSAAVLSLALPMTARASGEFVTRANDCNHSVFSSDGSEARLDIFDSRTTVDAFGSWMDWGNSVTSTSSRISGAHSVPKTSQDNEADGCPALGSLRITITSNPSIDQTQPTTATLTVGFPFGSPWPLPVKVWPMAAGDIRWSANTLLRDCLREQNGDLRLVQIAGRPAPTMIVEIPRRFSIAQCAQTHLNTVTGVTPNAFLDVAPASRAWDAVVTGLLNTNVASVNATCVRDSTCGASAATPLRVLPSWATLSALPHPSNRAATAAVSYAGKTLRTLDVQFVTVPADSGLPGAPRITVVSEGVAGGGGTVTSDPARITCTSSAATPVATCAADFSPVTLLSLTAAENAGSRFVGWVGCPVPTPNPVVCEFNTSDFPNALVRARFARAFRLTITKSGSGSGIVASDDGNIDCGLGCAFKYLDGGATVTLSATLLSGKTFTGWSNNCTPIDRQTCVVALNGTDQVVNAGFDAQ
jgi:hypothetical protein